MKTEQYYYAKDVTRITRISNRKLQYWDETGFISPSLRTRRRRKYSFRDVVLIKLINILTENGQSIQKLRNNIKRFDEIIPKDGDVPLESLVIYTDGENNVIVKKGVYCKIDFNQATYNFDLGELYQMALAVKENKDIQPTEQMSLDLSKTAKKQKHLNDGIKQK